MSRRTVTVPAARLVRWVDGFAVRHGGAEAERTPDGFVLRGTDGERAEAVLPFLPWDGSEEISSDCATMAAAALAHLGLPRRTVVLIVRRGGYACAVVETGPAAGQVIVSKVGSRHVQGRTAAGGWSQQRYARRRDKQASELVQAVADHAARLLLPALSEARRTGGGESSGSPGGSWARVWLVTGGDRALVGEVLADRRLEAVAGLTSWGHLPIGDPDRAVVAGLPERLTCVSLTLTS